MTRAALADWPGNVRQLRNAAQQLAIDWAGEPEILPGPAVDRLVAPLGAAREERAAPAGVLATSTPGDRAQSRPAEPKRTAAAKQPSVEASRVDLRDVTEAQLLEALRRHGFRAERAAKELGVSRTSVYSLIASSGRIHKAGDLSAEVIVRELGACGQDVARAARTLEVSERALKLRMKQLGLR
jgi:two-component system nitrogen regulation response regulator GlnG